MDMSIKLNASYSCWRRPGQQCPGKPASGGQAEADPESAGTAKQLTLEKAVTDIREFVPGFTAQPRLLHR